MMAACIEAGLARIPPSLEVLNTPRGTRFAFSNRVTLHFDNLDPIAPASNPWPTIDMTARAATMDAARRFERLHLGHGACLPEMA